MSEQDTSSDPQNNSASGTSSSSGASSNQANSNPVTESEKPNNPTTATSNKEEEKTEEKRNRFKEWLYKYDPEDNPILDSNELNNKYPIDILKSIFKPTTRDIQILIASLILATTHLSLYNLNIPIALEIIRILLMLALILYLARTLHVAYQNSRLIINSFKSNPLQFFTFIIACGGTFALIIPSTMNIFKLIGDSTPLTTAMLGITGGIIAVFGIIKTHQKNLLDEENLRLEREKYAKSIADKEKEIKEQKSTRQREKKQFQKSMKQQKYQFEKSLKQQIDALEEQKKQFNNSLKIQADKNAKDYARQVHEDRRSRYARAIEHIGNDKSAVRLGGIYTLISLIDEWLADKNIKAPKDRRKEGQIIVDSLCAYIRSPFHLADKRDILESDTPPDNYDGNFTSDREEFLEESNIRKSIFREINKRLTVEIDESNINKRNVSGTWSKFTFDFFAAPIFYILQYYTYVNTSFQAARFYGKAFFNNSQFFGTTDFTDAIFYGSADFNETLFIGKTSFQWANFHGPTSFLSVFTEEVTFENAEFINSIKFAPSLFEGPVSFKEVKFSQDPDFAGCEYIVSNDYPGGYILYDPAVFSYKIDSKAHNFTTSNFSNFEIALGKVNFKNNDYEIPEGAVVFDPDSWDKNQNDYIDKSQPAKK